MTEKRIPVRLPVELHKKFSKKLIDADMSAQEFFLGKVKEFVAVTTPQEGRKRNENSNDPIH